MSKLKDGKLIDVKVKQRIFSTIERGPLKKVVAIVVHQTGSSTAESTFNSYSHPANGAHFLIAKDGTIYQTARVTQRTFHVGRIQSRCLQTHQCDSTETKAANAILFQKGKSFSTRTNELAQFEAAKPYPTRYPTNDDSIGIEVVGRTQGIVYEEPTAAQAQSVKWLVAELKTELGLGAGDIYRHPEVSYKTPTEAKSVIW